MIAQEVISTETIKTSANGHVLRCQCDECETVIKDQFKPFYMVDWAQKICDVVMFCPKCRRPVYGRGRGGFAVWACWSCISKQAKVMKVVNKDSGGEVFSFATNEDNETVYFHSGKQTTIFCDGGDYPEMVDYNYHDTGFTVPSVGEEIIYSGIIGDRGLKAIWWAYSSELEQALEEIKNRPIYRFRWREGRKKLSKMDEAPRMHTLWEGKNLQDLRKSFHGQKELEDTMYSAKYFEKLISLADPKVEGSKDIWEPCADPR